MASFSGMFIIIPLLTVMVRFMALSSAAKGMIVASPV